MNSEGQVRGSSIAKKRIAPKSQQFDHGCSARGKRSQALIQQNNGAGMPAVEFAVWSVKESGKESR
jgi:hypothetical protein